MQEKITAGVFFGGASPEHEVSISSAAGVIPNIDSDRFDVKQIYIDRQGTFLTGNATLKSIQENKLDILSKISFDEIKSKIDVALPILHGAGGEDGSIQGLFSILQIPFAGCGITSSATCLDKHIFNDRMIANGIDKPKYVSIDWQYDNSSTVQDKINTIVESLAFPVFVKPARTGSSVGISKINKSEELQSGINVARKFDQKIIIEESIESNLEIEVAVLGNHFSNIEVSLPGSIIPGAEFYDYSDKYQNGKAAFQIPAMLPIEKITEIQNIARQAYSLAGCTGFARVDFLLETKTQKIYLNEINTIPGFTPISMYAKLWEATGLSYSKLITKIIDLALE